MEACNSWHYSDAAEIGDEADRIYIIRRVLEHFMDKVQTLYKLEQELSLDEAVMLWKGPNRMQILGKLVKIDMSYKQIGQT
jgi:hypothetical protein